MEKVLPRGTMQAIRWRLRTQQNLQSRRVEPSPVPAIESWSHHLASSKSLEVKDLYPDADLLSLPQEYEDLYPDTCQDVNDEMPDADLISAETSWNENWDARRRPGPNSVFQNKSGDSEVTVSPSSTRKKPTVTFKLPHEGIENEIENSKTNEREKSSEVFEKCIEDSDNASSERPKREGASISVESTSPLSPVGLAGAGRAAGFRLKYDFAPAPAARLTGGILKRTSPPRK